MPSSQLQRVQKVLALAGLFTCRHAFPGLRSPGDGSVLGYSQSCMSGRMLIQCCPGLNVRPASQDHTGLWAREQWYRSDACIRKGSTAQATRPFAACVSSALCWPGRAAGAVIRVAWLAACPVENRLHIFQSDRCLKLNSAFKQTMPVPKLLWMINALTQQVKHSILSLATSK